MSETLNTPEQNENLYELLAVNLEGFMRRFIPPGWQEPIAKATGVPNISADDSKNMAASFKAGTLETELDKDERFNAFYLKAAILSYFTEGRHKQFVLDS